MEVVIEISAKFGNLKQMIPKTTFYHDEWHQLSIQIQPIVEEMKKRGKDKVAVELTNFLEELNSYLTDFTTFVIKCMKKGKFAYIWSKTFVHDKYYKKYSDLNNRLKELQESPVITVSTCCHISDSPCDR